MGSQGASDECKHLSDFVFMFMANVTLVRRDTYLEHLRSGSKLETLVSLRNAGPPQKEG